MIAYKGFDQNLMCKDFQYEDNHDFVFDGFPLKCRQGFHACIMPLHVIHHYKVDSVYRKVEIPVETLDKQDQVYCNDSTICGSRIHIFDDKIGDLYDEQLMVMKYILKNCCTYSWIKTTDVMVVPYWIDSLRKIIITYAAVNAHYHNKELSLPRKVYTNGNESYFGSFSVDELASKMHSLTSTFWSFLIMHFEDRLDHTEFYKIMDTLTQPVPVLELHMSLIERGF